VIDIVAAVENIRQHLEAVAADARNKLEQDLPGLQVWAQHAASNPAVAALSAAVHLPEAPTVLATLATLIGDLDAALGAAKVTGAQQAAEQAEQQAPEPAAA
jgi:hypothetical protein